MNIEDVQEEIDLHIRRINAILPDLGSYLPLKSKDFENTDKIKTIDSFIYRFIKIQDKMGEKLFPAVLQLLQEYKQNMPLIDVLNKLEKLGIINSTDEWIDFRKLRNSLTHDYPDNEEEIIEAITLAVDVYKKMLIIYNNIKKLANARKKYDT